MRPSRLAALAGLVLALASAPPAHADRFAVRAAHFVDVRAGLVRGPVWVVVSADTIESVESAAPAGLAVTDLGGATLLPGLIGAHTHLGSQVGVDRMARLKSQAGARSIEHGTYMDAEAAAVLKAIASETSSAAEPMGWPGKVGVVAKGAYADLIAGAGDPTKDITELERVKWVMKGGKVYKDGLSR